MKISDTVRILQGLAAAHDSGWRRGITTICSASPMVIEAAMAEAAQAGQILCIEVSSHQVNPSGGYSGMTPDNLRAFVLDIAEGLSFPFDRIVLAGGSLGPAPWRGDTSENAMDRAADMVRAYAHAGFGKLHLDTSMPCAGDPVRLPPGLIAKRAAKLAKVAEDTVKELGIDSPAFVIGTESAVPGEAAVTPVPQLHEMRQQHRDAFGAQGQEEAFARTFAITVRPGIGFGHDHVDAFVPAGAADLADWRDATRGLIFEAPATDYQSPAALAALVDAGFGVLRVSPALTFALREALYGLDLIAADFSSYRATSLHAAMETALQSAPDHWKPYVSGSPAEQAIQRHYSYADRIRFYWTHPAAQKAVTDLFAALDGVEIPLPLISQYLPKVLDGVTTGRTAPTARALVLGYIRATLAPYTAACGAARPEIRMPGADTGPEAAMPDRAVAVAS